MRRTIVILVCSSLTCGVWGSLSRVACADRFVIVTSENQSNPTPPTKPGRPVPAPPPKVPKSNPNPSRAPAPVDPSPVTPPRNSQPALDPAATPAPAAPAPAESEAPTQRAPTVDPSKLTAPSTASVDGLEPQPLLLESLGVRFRPPANCAMRTDGTGTAARWTFAERVEAPPFILKVTRLVSQDGESTPDAQLDAYVHAMSERPADGENAPAFILKSRRALTVGGRPAAILQSVIRESDGLAAMQGFFVLQLSPTDFAVMSALTPEDESARVMPVLERSFETCEVVPVEELSAIVSARLDSAERFLSMLDEESMRAALDHSPVEGQDPPARIYRLARTLPDGTEQELGYLSLRVTEAPQGAANPDRDPAKWSEPEKQLGMLVRLQARTLLDEKGTSVADTDSRYWVRWDRQREFWTSRTTQRGPRKNRTSTQLGVRDEPTAGMPRPVLDVADSAPGGTNEPRRMRVPDRAYISLAEALVLPRLLARVADPGDYTFFWFDPRSDRPSARRDVLERVEGGFMLRSHASPDAPPTRQALGRRGELLRQEGDDGAFTVAIDPEELKRLWTSKGLPTE
jgi:hypothetical protein